MGVDIGSQEGVRDEMIDRRDRKEEGRRRIIREEVEWAG